MASNEEKMTRRSPLDFPIVFQNSESSKLLSNGNIASEKSKIIVTTSYYYLICNVIMKEV
ncbi:hypothetical protein Leryth_003707 [Lithospermum erythrorhizon]|nr:hypothetical protein Leryth_003707 [Lithospermum erythrorhizon]